MKPPANVSASTSRACNQQDCVVRVAVPVPLFDCFDYLAPAGTVAGCRVRVSFSGRSLVGVITQTNVTSGVPPAKLKPVDEVIDDDSLWPESTWNLLNWAARYYHHPVGEVFSAALPKPLREGSPPAQETVERLEATPAGKDHAALEQLSRAPLQAKLLRRAQQGPLEASHARKLSTGWRRAAETLAERGWLNINVGEPEPIEPATASAPKLTDEQAIAVEAITAAPAKHAPWLLHGVTGSGKTEVYLRLIDQALANHRQSLILVPEIGLTPQLARRLRKRLDCRVHVLHSNMAHGKRVDVWARARDGSARVIVGTRSAIFLPMRNLGLVVVDEEHDTSFKQQDGFCYHARDLAVWRGQQENAKVVLGSATPALESLLNAQTNRYHHLRLRQRVGQTRLPELRLVNIEHERADDGLSRAMRKAMAQVLAADQQVLLFLNRRGYAPVLLCPGCNWRAECNHCSAHMNLHLVPPRLICHHCGHTRPRPRVCPACQAQKPILVGQGTERLEESLAESFADVPIIRVDRDATARRGGLEALLESARKTAPAILLGTQMLAKGHHFPKVTLAGIVDVDASLFAADFRAPERLVQTVVQVAGRAGRGEGGGKVLLQTQTPDHPILGDVLRGNLDALAQRLLEQRREASLPPFICMAVLHSESRWRERPQEFLHQVRSRTEQYIGEANGAASQLACYGPLPSPMEKRADRYRFQLIWRSNSRKRLQRLLDEIAPQLPDWIPSGTRWRLDVDPVDLT